MMMRRSLAGDSSAENVAAQAKRVVDRYEVELANHFEIEEQVLFPACGASPLVEELVAEHRVLERLVEQLRGEPSTALLEQFCELLSRHIRREEDELFEDAQRSIPREKLDGLGEEIDRRAVRVCL